MARLIDRLMAHGYALEDATFAGAYRPYMNLLEQATVVVCDNVTGYHWDHRKDLEFPKDYPFLVPSPSPLFLESIVPVAQRYESGGMTSWGALAITHDLHRDRMTLDHHWVYRDEASASIDTKSRWLVEWLLYVEATEFSGKRGGPRRLLGWWGCPVLPTGVYDESENGRLSSSTFFMGNVPESEREGMGKLLLNLTRTHLAPLFLAVAFMHCKNVAQREVEQSSFERQVWRKKHGRPLVRYHVLDIDPMRKVLDSEGGAREAGLKKALHICRGHFATYTPDAPLFGRVTGTFWKPQHVRGNAKHGAVVKDYNVKAPKP